MTCQSINVDRLKEKLIFEIKTQSDAFKINECKLVKISRYKSIFIEDSLLLLSSDDKFFNQREFLVIQTKVKHVLLKI